MSAYSRYAARILALRLSSDGFKVLRMRGTPTLAEYKLKRVGSVGDFVMFPFYRRDGLRVVINVPITFPPKKVNGLMVSGELLLPL